MMLEKRKVVTVDGLAGSGKTSLSKVLAERLGFVHLNSGLLYRALGILVAKANIDPSNENRVSDLCKSAKIELILKSPTDPRVMIDGVDVTAKTQEPEISDFASKASVHTGVREYLLSAQRDAFPGSHLVAEGRDMGTVVFPQADIKFFVEVPVEVRAKRRASQMAIPDTGVDAAALMLSKEIHERDQRDTTRTASPTIAASNAVTIDNSSASLTQVVDSMYALAVARGVLSN